MRSLVVYCHPDPASFAAVARDIAVAALRGAGDEVRLIDLYVDGFDPVFSSGEHERHREVGGHPDVDRYVSDLAWCQRLVLVYPTWWSGPPAMLKGWIDRVWVRGPVWELPEGGGRLRGRLRNLRQLVVVTTHGSPRWVNMLQGEPGKRVVSRTLRAVCHPLARSRWIALYGMDGATPAQREAFLARLPRRVTR